ncbi:beta-ketoacyl synthase chain length factor [Niveibacterium sp. SC-1]|uniref:beta-ketoacyl synthase chain length factor n=1 Tax=Niveibacterium sp. SC-1 TaxID=3135646 RepID=UPI00311DDAF1
MRFALKNWAAWAPGREQGSDWEAWARSEVPEATQGEPAVPMVPAMLRRRADRLGRMALRVAYEALGERRGLPVVFVSAHGSVTRSASLLEELAAGVPLSPAGFASSVHNAATGLLGIAREDRAPCSALAAGDASVLAMLTEVAGFHADGYDEVLGILCDEEVPAYYAPYLDWPPSSAAWAGVIARGDVPADVSAQTSDIRMRFSATVDSPSHEFPAGSEEPLLAWIRWLLGTEPTLHCPGLGGSWRLERAD